MNRSIRHDSIRTWPALLAVVMLVGVLAGPAMAATEGNDKARVVLSGPVVVSAEEQSGTIVVFERPVTVGVETRAAVHAPDRWSDSVVR